MDRWKRKEPDGCSMQEDNNWVNCLSFIEQLLSENNDQIED